MEEGPAKPGATFTALMCVCHAVLQMLLCVIPPHRINESPLSRHRSKCVGVFLGVKN